MTTPGKYARVALAFAGAICVIASPGHAAQAAVTLTFLSRDFGVDFPHAFIKVTGATDAKPETAVQANYGFTAKVVSPAILLGPVDGEIMSAPDSYINGSDRHFSIKLADERYSTLLSLIAYWRSLPGRSYDLHRRNCVHFVKEVAKAVGLNVGNTDKFMLKPRTFLDEIALENYGKIENNPNYRPKLKP